MPILDISQELAHLDNQIKTMQKSIAASEKDLKNNPNDTPRNIFLQAKQANLERFQKRKAALEKQVKQTSKYKKK